MKHLERSSVKIVLFAVNVKNRWEMKSIQLRCVLYSNKQSWMINKICVGRELVL